MVTRREVCILLCFALPRSVLPLHRGLIHPLPSHGLATRHAEPSERAQRGFQIFTHAPIYRCMYEHIWYRSPSSTSLITSYTSIHRLVTTPPQPPHQ
jgi:hypothetical protein